jgi:hypothetical protein
MPWCERVVTQYFEIIQERQKTYLFFYVLINTSLILVFGFHSFTDIKLIGKVILFCQHKEIIDKISVTTLSHQKNKKNKKIIWCERVVTKYLL